MKKRQFTQGITIFTTPEMYEDIKKVSDERSISLSELFREMIASYLKNYLPDSHDGQSPGGIR